MITFLDFDSLMKLISIVKKFREDFTKEPTEEQLKYFKIFRSHFKTLLMLGLPSTL